MTDETRLLTAEETALLRESCDPQYRRLPMPERELVLRLLDAARASAVATCEHNAGWYAADHDMTRCVLCHRWRDEIMFEGGYRGEGEWAARGSVPALDVELLAEAMYEDAQTLATVVDDYPVGSPDEYEAEASRLAAEYARLAAARAIPALDVELRDAAQRLVDDWVGDDDEEEDQFCWACGKRRDLGHDDGCSFAALRAVLAKP